MVPCQYPWQYLLIFYVAKFVLSISLATFSYVKQGNINLKIHFHNLLQNFPMFIMTKGDIHLENIANILGEYGRAETLLNLVVPSNAFVKA